MSEPIVFSGSTYHHHPLLLQERSSEKARAIKCDDNLLRGLANKHVFVLETGGTTDGVCIPHTSRVLARVSFLLARSCSAPLVDQIFAPGRSPNTKKTDCTTQLTRAISRTGKYSIACARYVSDSRQQDILSSRAMIRRCVSGKKECAKAVP